MSRLRYMAGVAGLLCAASMPGLGVTLSIDSVTGTFSNAFPTSGGETVLFFDGNTEVRWGNNPQGDPRTSRSGLRFDGQAPPAFNATDGISFLLGTLTHFNHPIDDPITQVDMDLSLVVSNGGGPTNAGPFAFRYDVAETPNSDACNNGGVCTPADDDIITISALSPLTNIFVIGSTTYTLGITGFSTDGGLTITDFLRSPENADTAAGLYARFEVQNPDNPVPEPSSMTLVAGGLLAASARFLRSRRKQQR